MGWDERDGMISGECKSGLEMIPGCGVRGLLVSGVRELAVPFCLFCVSVMVEGRCGETRSWLGECWAEDERETLR